MIQTTITRLQTTNEKFQAKKKFARRFQGLEKEVNGLNCTEELELVDLEDGTAREMKFI